MAAHNELGKAGEQLAEQFFSGKGFTILFRNWRHSHYEIDLIAAREEMLHFIEVKTRKSWRFGLPEEDVDDKKINCLIEAGEEFLEQYPNWKRVQFDVLSITLFQNEPAEYFLIEDVYL